MTDRIAQLESENATLRGTVRALRGLLGSVDPVQYFEMADYPRECQVCEAEANDDGKPFVHKPDCAWLLNATPKDNP